MKTTSKVFIFIFTLLAVAASVYAQSPREQLQQVVAQLHQTPGLGFNFDEKAVRKYALDRAKPWTIIK